MFSSITWPTRVFWQCATMHIHLSVSGVTSDRNPRVCFVLKTSLCYGASDNVFVYYLAHTGLLAMCNNAHPSQRLWSNIRSEPTRLLRSEDKPLLRCLRQCFRLLLGPHGSSGNVQQCTSISASLE